MSSSLPYVATAGTIEKLLQKIKEAQIPPRFTQDFLSTSFGMSGGSAMSLIPLLKKLNFLGSDGIPTDLYRRFRNEHESKAVMAKAVRHGYRELFARNEYANQLTKEKLTQTVKEITGAAEDSSMLKQIVATFEVLKRHSDFASADAPQSSEVTTLTIPSEAAPTGRNAGFTPSHGRNLGFNLGYNINLNLPASSDIAVFNAIFKSLRENLLQNEN